MEDDHNIRLPKWKTTKEDAQNGRQSEWRSPNLKTARMERTKMEDEKMTKSKTTKNNCYIKEINLVNFTINKLIVKTFLY